MPTLITRILCLLLLYLAPFSHGQAAAQIQENTLELGDSYVYNPTPAIEYIVTTENPGLWQILENKDRVNWQKADSTFINFGYDNRGHWFRFKLHNRNPQVSQWALEINYPSLNHVELHILNEDNNVLESFVSGDSINFENRATPHPNIVFPINIQPEQTFMVYMYVKTSGAIQLPIRVWQWPEFNFNTVIQFLLQGLFYGIVLVMGIYNFFIWMSNRKFIYLNYTVYIILLCLFFSSLNGIGFRFLWPNHPYLNEIILPSVLALLIVSISYFIILFFKIKKTAPKLHYFVSFYTIFNVIAFVLTLMMPYSQSIKLLSVSSAIGIIMVISVILYMIKQNYPGTRYFTIAWFTWITGTGLLLTNKFGITPINIISEYGMQLGACLEVMFLSLALADRLNQNQNDKLKAQKRSLALALEVNHEKERSVQAELENLRLEKLHTQQLEKKVKDRTAELETTLKQLSIAHDQLEQSSITDSLTQVYNRLHFDKQYSAEFKRAHRQNTDLSLMLLDIDYFKKINDRYGHQAGDLCLQKAAECLANTVSRENDLVCRYGGEEFAIILPITNSQGAMDVAQEIMKNIRDLKVLWEGKIIELTISIGISDIKQSDNDTDLIKFADMALYQAKGAGRDQAIIYAQNLN